MTPLPFGQSLSDALVARPERIRRVALIWIIAAIAVFIVLAFVLGIPRSPEMRTAEAPIQFGLLAVAVIGGVAAFRFPGFGATLITLAAFGIGIYASVELHPVIAFSATLALLVPGVLLWFTWQRSHGPVAVAGLAVAMVGLLAGGYAAASTFYTTYYGSSHPESEVRLADSVAEWIWSGGITPESAVVVAKPAARTGNASLAVWADDGGDTWTVTGEENADGKMRFDVVGLEAETRYLYALEVGGDRDDVRIGSFTTAPTGPASFTVAFASCARTGTNGAVFDAIRAIEPLMFIEYGDLFYGDVPDYNLDHYRDHYDALLTSPGPQSLWLDVPIVYVWDDHDFGTNDSHRASPGGAAAAAVYRENVPHYPLQSSGNGIYQAFSVGRVRFIATDIRFDRDEKTVPDGPDKTMLGAEQKAWFINELQTAAENSALVVWINPVPWVVTASAEGDSWGGYSTERRQIADEIARLGLADRLVMVSGDAHMLAIDDGTNTDFSTSGGAGFVLMQASALDRIGSLKGGPYSEGAHPGGGQFGTLDVVDRGATMDLTLTGRDWTGATLMSYSFTAQIPEGTP